MVSLFQTFPAKIVLAKTVTRFSQDIGTNFGQDKFAHLVIEKGQIKHTGQHLEMNGVKIQKVHEGECYKYLGQDENISYVGTVNKERVCKEYFTRVRKIWKSKLSAFNKTIAYNVCCSFAKTNIRYFRLDHSGN